MESGASVAKLWCMTTREVTITLELRQAGEELDGSASDGNGIDRSFSGWLGLLVTLDSMLDAAGDEPSDET